MVKHQNTNSSVHAALRAIYLQTRTHEIKTGGCEASPASLSSLHSHIAQRHRRPLQADTPPPHLPASTASRATSVQFNPVKLSLNSFKLFQLTRAMQSDVCSLPLQSITAHSHLIRHRMTSAPVRAQLSSSTGAAGLCLTQSAAVTH